MVIALRLAPARYTSVLKVTKRAVPRKRAVDAMAMELNRPLTRHGSPIPAFIPALAL